MKTKRLNHGKISEHFKGLGTVTQEAVEERAREIALINGRGPNHFTSQDLEEAKRELTDPAAEAGEELVAGLVTWDEGPDASGHAVAKEIAEDEQSYSALLAEEGMEEAEHEHMVEGARNPHNQE